MRSTEKALSIRKETGTSHVATTEQSVDMVRSDCIAKDWCAFTVISAVTVFTRRRVSCSIRFSAMVMRMKCRVLKDCVSERVTRT
ncbi:hypothetical protein NESM_000917200 [Novymonas esmeraldas]|uniref:Uncharacterized protein n=1 Tax=Novymonas esmeraldas TaxID=1808958 RepID=A0AAW0F2Y1_9TRYP